MEILTMKMAFGLGLVKLGRSGFHFYNFAKKLFV